jgi:hypothetical protein
MVNMQFHVVGDQVGQERTSRAGTTRTVPTGRMVKPRLAAIRGLMRAARQEREATFWTVSGVEAWLSFH